MNKSLITCLALLISVSGAWADPVGTWEISMEGPGGTLVNYLTIRKEGDSHFGSMRTPQGEAEIGELEVDDDHIEFAFSPVATMTFSYECDVEGDVLTGKVTTPRGTMMFAGTRQ